MDLVNNYGSSDEEDNVQTTQVNTNSSVVKIDAAPETGFDVSTEREREKASLACSCLRIGS